MLKAKWNGTIWEETATSEEIEASKPKRVELPPPTIELLEKSITDLEIRDIEKDIAITDLEILVYELQSKVEV